MKADECSNIQEIRTEIDRIAREVIIALGKRFAYVKAAAKFKTSEDLTLCYNKDGFGLKKQV